MTDPRTTNPRTINPRLAQRLRRANGVVSLCLVGALALHAVANSLRLGGIDAPSFALLAWAAVCAGVAHAALCIATSAAMLSDTERPPSHKKKQHLVVKWVTGALVAIAAGLHVAASQGVLGPAGAQAGRWLMVAAAVALGAHLWTGTRSLLKDVGLPRSWKPAVRALVVGGTLVVCALVLSAAYA